MAMTCRSRSLLIPPSQLSKKGTLEFIKKRKSSPLIPDRSKSTAKKSGIAKIFPLEMFVDPRTRKTKQYFNIFALPLDVIRYCFTWLEPKELSSLNSVNTVMARLGGDDICWKPLYTDRFGTAKRPYPNPPGYRQSYIERLRDPAAGDKVEVAWEGRFRLETDDVYHGLAWWVAEVVEKSDEKGYLIHYPGWEHRWDEWVQRERMRWAGVSNQQQVGRIGIGDSVEIMCCGSSVPGAWLRTTVIDVQGTNFEVGPVLQSGNVWITSDRLRLVEKAVVEPKHVAVPRKSLRQKAGCVIM